MEGGLQGAHTPGGRASHHPCPPLLPPSWSRYILQTYARPDIVFTHGEGARMYDAYGKEYLDFAAGIAVNALGEAAVGWWVLAAVSLWVLRPALMWVLLGGAVFMKVESASGC